MTVQSISKICSVDGCGEHPRTIRGRCAKHNYRFRKYGNVDEVQTLRGIGNTPTARFWSRVAVTSNPDRCWLWQGKPFGFGYGQVTFEGKNRLTHIVAWRLQNGYYPTLCLLHKCDVPLCVNPNHLFEGTRADNTRDMQSKGRGAFGERSGTAKLTSAAVVEMRTLRQLGRTIDQLAKQFGVSEGTVRPALSGKTWRHVQ